MNNYFFNKIANLFGDTRNMIKKFKASGGEITRDSFDSGNFRKTLNGKKIINIPRVVVDHKRYNKDLASLLKKKFLFIKNEDIIKLRKKTLKKSTEKIKDPRLTFAHEFGHSIVSKNRKIPNNIDVNEGMLKKLKQERMANSNALQHITDPKDREAYKKFTNKPYASYRNTDTNDYLKNRLILKSKNKNYINHHIKNLFKKETPILDTISDMHAVQTVIPSLRKKPWER